MRRPLSALLVLAAVVTLSAWLARPRTAPEPHGEWVKFTNAAGETIPAYVAWPERKDRAPTIIVIHQIFGLTPWETTVVDKLAAQGYVAVAPDGSTVINGAPGTPQNQLVPVGNLESLGGRSETRTGSLGPLRFLAAIGADGSAVRL